MEEETFDINVKNNNKELISLDRIVMYLYNYITIKLMKNLA